jgi:microcystin-dependent protein
MGPSYDGVGANASYDVTTHYGVSWIRGTHPEAIAQLSEGVYVYQNGILKGGIGSAGIYTAGIFYGSGAGLTALNAGNLASGILPDARLSGTYTGVNITGNAATANKWAAMRTLTFTGGATGSISFDGSANVSVALTVQPSAHIHTIAQVTGLDTELTAAAPPSAIMAFPLTAAPAGWLKCNGAAISRTTYADLFAAVGTRFGVGDGSTTFNLPDARGEFLRGWDDARGIDAGRVLGSWQADMHAAHTHTGTTTSDAHTHTWSGTTSSAGAHTHPLTGASGTGSNSHMGFQDVNGATLQTGSAGAHTHTMSGTTSSDSHNHTFTTAASGGTETRPRNLAFLICIKY